MAPWRVAGEFVGDIREGSILPGSASQRLGAPADRQYRLDGDSQEAQYSARGHKRLSLSEQEDSRPHDLMLCLQTGKTLNDPNRMKFDTDQLYVKSTEEIAARLCGISRGRENTCRIADQCDLELAFNKTYLAAIQCAGRLHARNLSWSNWRWRDLRPD